MPRQRPRRRRTRNHRRRVVRDTQCDYHADRSLNAGGSGSVQPECQNSVPVVLLSSVGEAEDAELEGFAGE